MSKFSCFFVALLVGKKKRSKNPNPILNNLDPMPPVPDPIHADIPPDPAAYEGGDEHDETLPMKRDHSDLDLQALAAADPVFCNNQEPDRPSREDDVTPTTPEFLPADAGHVSDPGAGPAGASLWGPPALKRSCSNIETKRAVKTRFLGPPRKEMDKGSSPLSVRSDCSADKVMLKKRSSSQVLPSRSRKLWWKLFLWSHRSLHGPVPPTTATSAKRNRRGGYSSDTLEPAPDRDKRKQKAPMEWVAFSAESSSPLWRVNAWVDSLEEGRFLPVDEDEDKGGFEFPGFDYEPGPRLAEEVVQANNVIQSLNSLSSVAHISGMGLKVVPNISAFTGLRSVNLSGNYIVQINSGMLPKSLHALDLSRNKIAVVEGLKELTRLRVLNLSYNRISRIGHGLSNCTLIKELYLAGNKISDVEGLHRLLKLTVLDLSFNKIATAKALGQLVANYNSLLAINLIGNPVQTNIGDDHLRKAVSSLLPHLIYLNKQPIKPQRAREVSTDSVAKAALSSSSTATRRRMTRQTSKVSGMGSSLSSHYHQSNRHKHKGRQPTPKHPSRSFNLNGNL